MKRTIRLFLALTVGCWLVAGFASCSKDDDEARSNLAPQMFADKLIKTTMADVSRIYMKDSEGNTVAIDTLVSDTTYYKYDQHNRITELYGNYQRGAFYIDQNKKKVFLNGDYLESDFLNTADNFFHSMSLFWDLLIAKGDYKMNMEYDADKHLISIGLEEGTTIATSAYLVTARLDYTWTDGKLMKAVVTYNENVTTEGTTFKTQYIAECDYSYTSQTENKWKQWTYFTSASMSLFDFASFAMPGYFGIGPTMLPDSFKGTVTTISQADGQPQQVETLSVESTCEYTLNADGTVKTERISKLPFAVAMNETEGVTWLVTDEKVTYCYE